MTAEVNNMQNITLNLGYKTSGNDVWEDIVTKDALIPSDHRYLNSFLTYDYSEVESMVNTAVRYGEKDDAEFAKKLLMESHPYFTEDRAAWYVNRSIADIAWNDPDIQDPNACLEAVGVKSDIYSDSEYWLGQNDRTASSLSEKQYDAKYKVALLLDDTNPEFAKTPMPVRAGIYGLVSGRPDFSPEVITVESKYILPFSESMNPLKATMDFYGDFAAKVYESVNLLTEDMSVIPEGLRPILDTTKAGDEEPRIEYMVKSLEGLIDIEIYLLLTEGTRLKRCKKCGRYYPVSVLNPGYCNIMDSTGTSCLSEYMQNNYAEALHGIYTQAYRTMHARLRKGKISKEELDIWRHKAKDITSKVYECKIAVGDYKNRLMSI